MITSEELREAYIGKQMSIRAIAEERGCSKGEVHYLLVKYGISRRHCGRPRNLSPANRKSILRMRKLGYPQNWIAGMLGIERSHVWRTLKAEGMVGTRDKPVWCGSFRDAEPMVG